MNNLSSSNNGLIGTFLFISSFIAVNGLRIRMASSLPPRAKRIDHTVYFGMNPQNKNEYRGVSPMIPPKTKNDPYYWLRDDERKDPHVINYLNQENKYTEKNLKYLESSREELSKDILSHLKETEDDLPYQSCGYMYYSRTVKGMPYKIHCRKIIDNYRDRVDVEDVLLDENVLAEGKEYSDVSCHEVSPGNNLLAYAVDNSAYETYTVYIKDLNSNKLLDDVLEETSGEVLWGNDDSCIFYMKMDSEHRPDRLFMHVLGTKQDDDICCYTENDRTFWLGIDKSMSKRFLFLESGSKETTEVHTLDLMNVYGSEAHLNLTSNKLACVRPRVDGIRYSVEHHGTDLYIVTNENNSKNMKLMKAMISKPDVWTDVKSYDPRIQIDHVIPFENHLAIFGRAEGLEQVWVAGIANSSDWKRLQFPESIYSVWADQNEEYSCKTLRIGYSSLVTPKQIIDYDLNAHTMSIMKEQEVPLYDKDSYATCRLHAIASDGTRIPMSIVYNKHKSRCGADITHPIEKSPLILYGYGSYGVCIDPVFDYKRITLLDRGVIYCIAHIRGGGEMGRHWYEDEGKYLTKMNTFTDFASCLKHLAAEGISDATMTACVGRSAGGLLIGGVLNMYPNLFKVGIADVPFVDAITTMSDPTIPLTVGEWSEWGNPNEDKFYDYMKSYSPVDNVQRQNYPSILVTAGLFDPRVAYFEPAKWVATLRDMKLDNNPLYLKTDMSSGHFSASDRYKYIKECAFEYAFILDQILEKKVEKDD